VKTIEACKIIAERSAEDLDRAVTEAIEKGSEIYGNPFSHGGFLCQAVLVPKHFEPVQPPMPRMVGG
jgi:hypothetical protein